MFENQIAALFQFAFEEQPLSFVLEEMVSIIPAASCKPSRLTSKSDESERSRSPPFVRRRRCRMIYIGRVQRKGRRRIALLTAGGNGKVPDRFPKTILEHVTRHNLSL